MKWFKQGTRNDVHEFQPLLVEIEDRPLNPLGRSILWIIFGVILFGILWLSFATIDIVVSARGKVVPTGEIKVLQPIETGVISKILVKEGEHVQKDQVLMQIDPSVTQTSLASKDKDLVVHILECERLSALVDNRKPKWNEYTHLDTALLNEQKDLYLHQRDSLSASKSQYAMKKSQAEAQYSSAKSDVQRLEGIFQKEQMRLKRMEKVLDIIARNDYEEAQKSANNIHEQLNMAHHKERESKQHLKEVEHEAKVYVEQTLSTWFNQLLDKKKELRALESEINAIAFQNRQQQIKAPLSGYIGKLMVNTEGGVVTPAEKLISLVPDDAPLIIKATVLNQDRGFITKEMPAAIKIDTFTFQKYGFIEGIVDSIGNDAIEDEKQGLIYEIKVIPSTTSLMIDGKEKRLEPGMNVTTEIKVGKRKIIEFFIYPIIQYMDEGLSVR
ncbi:HlyD family type I secretion periplasmic adaptor subunit [Sulfurospirillum halorespirans]|uniref:Type I secretion membrane fusion protein, HlyD family n=1 Tax=Sulfurospirillum halorespirans DSM 13726 TaxID=1193502 RepID=A0A1D7TGU0_9BACT|nr:HlyD family type I secretion periplasmic adaptor subunit [Sulfurospirillum halorespirans]AOO64217.1 type I secretion membrane fusion protein, HlyD family [Sulfurospirillum halorespirans DSM 13726]